MQPKSFPSYRLKDGFQLRLRIGKVVTIILVPRYFPHKHPYARWLLFVGLRDLPNEPILLPCVPFPSNPIIDLTMKPNRTPTLTSPREYPLFPTSFAFAKSVEI